jgi:formylglycine-generating enzyme required for sulfatase activity
MGSPEDEAGRDDDEGPRHEVELTRGYWLFDTPCTQALWQAVMGVGENPSRSRFQGENRPVENVSWEDCQAFIGKLNEALPGLELSLPTEAQWEYACRAGTQTARYASDLDAIAWYRENSSGETHEVGQKRPNAWGLYDMLGNVWEWVQDGYAEDYYQHSPTVDPQGLDAGADRVSRGGSWSVVALSVRAASRSGLVPGLRHVALGFRCSSSGPSR